MSQLKTRVASAGSTGFAKSRGILSLGVPEGVVGIGLIDPALNVSGNALIAHPPYQFSFRQCESP